MADYAQKLVLLCGFRTTIGPLKDSPYLGHQPLTHFVQGGVDNWDLSNVAFSGDHTQKWCNVLGVSCKGLDYRVKYWTISEFGGWALNSWSYPVSNMGDCTVYEQKARKFQSPHRWPYRLGLMGKISGFKLDLKNWTTVTTNGNTPPHRRFSAVIGGHAPMEKKPSRLRPRRVSPDQRNRRSLLVDATVVVKVSKARYTSPVFTAVNTSVS